MFMLKSTHEAKLAKALANQKGFHDVKMGEALDRNTELVRQASRATARALNAERQITELKPLADRMKAKLERDRKYSRNRKAAK
jgi:tRNA A58 N-methylase Trm61